MKQINVWFENKEHEDLQSLKSELELNWHDFILYLFRLSQETED